MNFTPFCRDHYVSMDVKVGDTSYSGYGHGSRVSGVNTRCVDHGTNKPSEWVSLKNIGSLYLYTSDLGTTLPPDLGTYTFTYIGFRQNRLRYYMINGTKVHQ